MGVHHKLILLAPSNQFSPVLIGSQGIDIPHYKQPFFGSGQGHTHSPGVPQKTNVLAWVATDTAHDDDVSLHALVPVHGIHFNGQSLLNALLLGIVGGDDPDTDIGLLLQSEQNLLNHGDLFLIVVRVVPEVFPALHLVDAHLDELVGEGEVQRVLPAHAVLQQIVIELKRGEQGNGGVHAILGGQQFGLNALLDEAFKQGNGQAFRLGQHRQHRRRQLLVVSDQHQLLALLKQGHQGRYFGGLGGFVDQHAGEGVRFQVLRLTAHARAANAK